MILFRMKFVKTVNYLVRALFAQISVQIVMKESTPDRQIQFKIGSRIFLLRIKVLHASIACSLHSASSSHRLNIHVLGVRIVLQIVRDLVVQTFSTHDSLPKGRLCRFAEVLVGYFHIVDHRPFRLVVPDKNSMTPIAAEIR